MKPEHVILSIFMAIALIGVFTIVKPSVTGNISTLQKWPAIGGIENKVDRQCQYFSIDCELVQQRPMTFETLLWTRCEAMNRHSKSCMAKCIEQGLREAEFQCPAASPYLSVLKDLAPTMATGQIAVDANSCARTADEYDFVLQKTLDTADIPLRDATALNPCTGQKQRALTQVMTTETPFRVQSRVLFDNDVFGSISGKVPGQGDIIFARCSDGRAKLSVSGVDVCNTI